MFEPVGSTEFPLNLFLDGQPIKARAGETVAACLMRAGTEYFRKTPVSRSPRLPYCMIGHCFESLVEINGVANQQACLMLVLEGMQVRRQHGAGAVYRQGAG